MLLQSYDNTYQLSAAKQTIKQVSNTVISRIARFCLVFPDRSAYWDECLYSHSGLLLCSRTIKPYLPFLSVRLVRYNIMCLHTNSQRECILELEKHRHTS
jgi:hypothetical protein